MRKLILFVVIVTTTAMELPSSFTTCKYDSNECHEIGIKNALMTFKKGLRDFKIMPMEPLVIDYMKIADITSKSVSITQEYRNVTISGWTKGFKILNFRSQWNKLMFYFEHFIPHVKFAADYKFDGKIFVVPMQGQGKAEINLYNVSSMNEIHFEKFSKNGDKYLRAIKYKLHQNPQHVTLDYKNLISAGSTLGKLFTEEQLNQLLNENAKTLYEEVNPAFEDVFDRILLQIANNIYTRVPLKKMYPDTFELI